MWYPTDESFLAMQGQENFARAQIEIAAASTVNNTVASAAVNATASSGLLASLHLADSDSDTAATAAGVVVLLLIWLVLCGICRCYVCVPCPCCFCYIPCCCGFCLKEEVKENMKSPNDIYHRHDHIVSYPDRRGGAPPPPAAATRGHGHYYDHAEIPAYSSITMDVEEPLLGPPAYRQPREHEAPPPAYHNVPTAPPLS